MAQLVTWDEFTGTEVKGGTIREIVMAEVVNSIATDRPFFTLLDAEPVEGLFIERLEDVLADRAHNAVEEGVAHTAAPLSQPGRLGYHVQRFAKWGQLADEQRDTSHYNEDPFSYQVGKKMEELLNDLEHALQQGTVVSGASGTARQLEGLLEIADQVGTQTFQTDSSGTTFTEAEFISRLQDFKDADFNVTPNVALVNSWLKRSISEFSTKITRNVDMDARRQALVIERHTSDFGDVDIVYTRDQLLANSATEQGNSISLFEDRMLRKGVFKAPTFEQLSRDGFRDRFQLTTQFTLVYKTRKAVGGGKGYVANITLS